MMFEPDHLYESSEMKKHAQDKLGTAKAVESVLKSPGWKLYAALVRRKWIAVMTRDDYPDLESFRADRAGIRFLLGTVAEFEAYREDADDAIAMLKELHKAENQTPLPTEAGLTAREE